MKEIWKKPPPLIRHCYCEWFCFWRMATKVVKWFWENEIVWEIDCKTDFKFKEVFGFRRRFLVILRTMRFLYSTLDWKAHLQFDWIVSKLPNYISIFGTLQRRCATARFEFEFAFSMSNLFLADTQFFVEDTQFLWWIWIFLICLQNKTITFLSKGTHFPGNMAGLLQNCLSAAKCCISNMRNFILTQTQT